MADSKKLHSCLGFETNKNIGFLFLFSILLFLFLAPLLSKIWGVIWDGIQKQISLVAMEVVVQQHEAHCITKGNLPNHFEDQESEPLPVSFTARTCIS